MTYAIVQDYDRVHLVEVVKFTPQRLYFKHVEQPGGIENNTWFGSGVEPNKYVDLHKVVVLDATPALFLDLVAAVNQGEEELKAMEEALEEPLKAMKERRKAMIAAFDQEHKKPLSDRYDAVVDAAHARIQQVLGSDKRVRLSVNHWQFRD